MSTTTVKVTDKLLANVGPKGKYLVVRLSVTHNQPGCAPVPAGTVGVVKFRKGVECGFVFPHTVLGGTHVFTDGDLRIVPFANLVPLGRVG